MTNARLRVPTTLVDSDGSTNLTIGELIPGSWEARASPSMFLLVEVSLGKPMVDSQLDN